MYESMVILGCIVFFYSLTSGGLEKTPINGALVFLLLGVAAGPMGFNLLKIEVHNEVLSLLAEMTLALLLFTDAANADLKTLEKSYKIPQRLLLVGLPLTILLGIAGGELIFASLSIAEVAILATILAPTDAALGKAVVTNEKVPGRIREGLNVESGLNDGLCVPVLFILLAVEAGVESNLSTPEMAVIQVVKGLGIGIGVGTTLTVLAYWLIKFCAAHGWMTATWRQLPVVSLALVCFAVAQLLGGSGFIACFCGGLLFDRIEKTHKQKLLIAAEGTGDTLALITWVLFGAMVVGRTYYAFTWHIILYALLSLTVIRMLPVFLSLSGLNLKTSEKLFMGWFGPRGLASIVFAVIVFNAGMEHSHTISLTVVCTVMFSIVLHGVSANPLVRKLTGQS